MSDFIPVSFCTFRSPIVIWGSQHLGDDGVSLGRKSCCPTNYLFKFIKLFSFSKFFLLDLDGSLSRKADALGTCRRQRFPLHTVELVKTGQIFFG